MTQTPCCVMCRESLNDNFCNLPTCKCHTAVEEAPKEDWREDIYAILPILGNSLNDDSKMRQILKVVEPIVASVRQEGVEEAKEAYWEGIKVMQEEVEKSEKFGRAAVIAELLAEWPEQKNGLDSTKDGYFLIGYHEALAATRALLKAKAKEE